MRVQRAMGPRVFVPPCLTAELFPNARVGTSDSRFASARGGGDPEIRAQRGPHGRLPRVVIGPFVSAKEKSPIAEFGAGRHGHG